MGNGKAVLDRINEIIQQQDRSFAWVARNSGVPYKRVLAEVKDRTSPVKLETSIAVCLALGTTLGTVYAAVSGEGEQAAAA